MEGHAGLDVEVLGNTATFGDALARSSMAVVALVSGALELFFLFTSHRQLQCLFNWFCPCLGKGLFLGAPMRVGMSVNLSPAIC